MTKDQIIAMAQSVGAAFDQTMYGRTDYVVMTAFELERFAQLIATQAAAEERELCAKAVASLEAKRPEIEGYDDTGEYIVWNASGRLDEKWVEQDGAVAAIRQRGMK